MNLGKLLKDMAKPSKFPTKCGIKAILLLIVSVFVTGSLCTNHYDNNRIAFNPKEASSVYGLRRYQDPKSRSPAELNLNLNFRPPKFENIKTPIGEIDDENKIYSQTYGSNKNHIMKHSPPFSLLKDDRHRMETYFPTKLSSVKRNIVKKELIPSGPPFSANDRFNGKSACAEKFCPPFQTCIKSSTTTSAAECMCDDALDLTEENHECIEIYDIREDKEFDQRVCTSAGKIEPNICAFYMNVCMAKNGSITLKPLSFCLDQGLTHKRLLENRDFDLKPKDFGPEVAALTGKGLDTSLLNRSVHEEFDKIMAYIKNKEKQDTAKRIEKLGYAKINNPDDYYDKQQTGNYEASSTVADVITNRPAESAISNSRKLSEAEAPTLNPILDTISNNILRWNYNQRQKLMRDQRKRVHPPTLRKIKKVRINITSEFFKRWLKEHYKREFIDNNDPFAKDDIYLTNLIFGSWDVNRDNYVTIDELAFSEARKREFNKIALQNYSWPKIRQFLENLLIEGDVDKDAKLDLREFYQLFSTKKIKASMIPGPDITHMTGEVGKSLNMHCKLKSIFPASIIWMRYQKSLSQLINVGEYQIFRDASLYIPRLSMKHTGNFSCLLAESNRDAHIFVVRIVKSPKVIIKPTQGQVVKISPYQNVVTFQCKATGWPIPEDVKWFKNHHQIFPQTNHSPTGDITGLRQHNNYSAYEFKGRGSVLRIFNVDYFDNGAYTCQFLNEAGTRQAHSDLYVLEGDAKDDIRNDLKYAETANNFLQKSQNRGLDENDRTSGIYLFDKTGLKIFDPKSCELRDKIGGDAKITILNYYANSISGNEATNPGNEGMRQPPSPNLHQGDARTDFQRYYVCQSRYCQWGKAFNVKDKYIYALQTDTSRVVIYEIETQKFREEMLTDLNPVDIKYVAHLDQIWILSQPQKIMLPGDEIVEDLNPQMNPFKNDEGTNGSNYGKIKAKLKTFQVIKYASRSQLHNIIHTKPRFGHFDQVSDIFLPQGFEDNDLDAGVNYGYLTFLGKQKLTKLDLLSLEYASSIDLKSYGCYPTNVAFYPYGGSIIVQCLNKLRYDKGQLMLDVQTDSILRFNVHIHGTPLVAPDQKYVATVDKRTRIVRIQDLDQIKGPGYAYDVIVPFTPDVVEYNFASYGNTPSTYDLIFGSNEQSGLVIFNRYNHSNFDVINDYEKLKGGSRVLRNNRLNWNTMQDGEKNQLLINQHHSRYQASKMFLKSSGNFGEYLILLHADDVLRGHQKDTGRLKIFVIDMETKKTRCQIDESLIQTNVIKSKIPLGSQYGSGITIITSA